MSIDFWGLLRVEVLLVNSSASKSSFSSQSLIEALHLQNLCWLNLLNNDLGDSVVFPYVNSNKLLDFEVFSSMVEQDDTNLSSVIFIDDTSTDVDGIFPGKTRSGSNSAVCVGWDHPAETSLDHGFTSSRDSGLLRGTDIVAGSERGSLFGDDGVFIEFLDKELADLLANFFGL